MEFKCQKIHAQEVSWNGMEMKPQNVIAGGIKGSEGVAGDSLKVINQNTGLFCCWNSCRIQKNAFLLNSDLKSQEYPGDFEYHNFSD